MTWFRVEAGLPRHELVGAIAEALKVEISTALGFYVGTLAGFADYQPDGLVKSVTSATLEEWAGWRGKPGRYATFFRSRCVETRQGQPDAPGVVKGWWRNRKLLEKQERDRLRPGQGTRKALQGPQGAFDVPFGGNVDVDVNGTNYIDGSPRARALYDKMPAAGGSALVGYLRAARDPERVCLELESYLNGMGGPGGRSVTPEQLGRALHDMALAGAKLTSRVLAGFVRGVLAPEPPARSRDKPEGDLSGWVARKERERAASR